MRRLEGHGWYIDAFDNDVYTAESNLIRAVATSDAPRFAFDIEDENGRLARYIAVKDGADFVADIDLSEYIRMVGTPETGYPSVYVYARYWDEVTKSWVLFDEGEIEVYWQIVGLHNPVKLLRHSGWMEDWYEDLDKTAIYPPRKMYKDVTQFAPFTADTTEYHAVALLVTGSTASLAVVDRGVSIPPRLRVGSRYVKVIGFGIYSENYDDPYPIVFEVKNPCREYVNVRWQFPTGVTAQHALEIRDFKDNTSESIAMDVVGEGYDVRKGIGQTFVLHLDGLCPYDYWYYGTIVTSSKVEVEINGEWRSVEVTTKKVEQPNTANVKTRSLDIEVKLNSYKAL